MNQIKIKTNEVRFPTSPELYGLFFEDINRAADGGLYAEMLRNRAFEDSIIPDGCTTDEKKAIITTQHKWSGAFNHGEGIDEWASAVPETSVPAWYVNGAEFELDTEDTLNQNRKAALKVRFQADGFLENIGYCGIYVEEDHTYCFSCFVKGNYQGTLMTEIYGDNGVYASADLQVYPSDTYVKYENILKADKTNYNARFRIVCPKEAVLVFGFTSLMPEKTFCGHGLREDLAIALKNTNSKFIRFPGGCVVEGINEENTLSFHKTIGPVHERPSSWLMWHYRTTNGLGFHEYLQLCEDLDMEALYVVNCGMSCQVRGGKGYSEEKTEEYLQEALNALEYALGSEDSKYGSLRKKYGHPDPFKLKYVEIGNENLGPQYTERYKRFYKALKEAYPNVIYIADIRTEEQDLPMEMVDEHYYDSPEFFHESWDMFDSYDRSGPGCLIGEYAVYMLINQDDVIASMKCALAEAVFLTGAERNQDIIRLTSYAPLFQNGNYTAWRPNLIVFNNHQVFGIPSYHVISLMGKYHGDQVVQIESNCELKPSPYIGLPGIESGKEGLEFKNVKVNGKPVSISQQVHGTTQYCEECDSYKMLNITKKETFSGYCNEWNDTVKDFFECQDFFQPKNSIWSLFGDQELREMTFEADIKFDKDNSVSINVWNRYPDTAYGACEPKSSEWTDFLVRNQVWRIENGLSSTRIPKLFDKPLCREECVELDIDYCKFNHYEIKCNRDSYACYLNGKLIHEKTLKKYPVISVSCETKEDEIFLKLVNIENTEKSVMISLDCEIKREIKIERITAKPNDVNTFDNPENVSPVTETILCGKKVFSYTIPGNTISILIMEKVQKG